MNKMDMYVKKKEKQIGPCEKKDMSSLKISRYSLFPFELFRSRISCTNFERITHIKTWTDREIHPL